MRNVCLKMVYQLAKQDERVVFIGSDLSPGLLKEMKAEFPDRYYMEGVTEANIIGMAAGLAMEGYIPYVNTIATFITRRCYEQVAVDLCLHDLPVRLIGNGGGLVYAPLGPTHLAIEDITIMRALPNMAVISVCDAEEMVRMMEKTIDWPHPVYIRLAKGGDEVVSSKDAQFSIGKTITMHQHKGKLNILLISTGVMTQRALKIAKILEAMDIGATLLHCHTVKPLDEVSIIHHAKHAQLIVTMEENILIGGLGSAVTDCLTDFFGRNTPLIKRFGIPDRFSDKYGSQDSLMDYYGLSVEKMLEKIKEMLRINFTGSVSVKELDQVN